MRYVPFFCDIFVTTLLKPSDSPLQKNNNNKKQKTKTTKTKLCAMTVEQPGGRERHATDVKRFMFNVNAFDTTAHVLFTSCGLDSTKLRSEIVRFCVAPLFARGFTPG